MLGCHQALVAYDEATAAANGPIVPRLVDAYLAPGVADPGTFTYIAAAPGTVVTYIAVPANYQDLVIAALQKITGQTVIAGPVSGGVIVPPLAGPSVAVPAGVPNGVIAMLSVVRNN
jgi:hypothetical protein